MGVGVGVGVGEGEGVGVGVAVGEGEGVGVRVSWFGHPPNRGLLHETEGGYRREIVSDLDGVVTSIPDVALKTCL